MIRTEVLPVATCAGCERYEQCASFRVTGGKHPLVVCGGCMGSMRYRLRAAVVGCAATKPQRCTACGALEPCAEVRGGADDQRCFALCASKCGPRLVALLGEAPSMSPGDAVEWDPHYQPPPWARYSEAALARQRGTS